MKNFARKAVATIAFLPIAVIAQDSSSHLCMNGDIQRRVEIIYEGGRTVPCEVHYFKDTEAPGEHQVLWRALSEEGYCEEQATAFVEQLTRWGWTCARTVPAMPVGDDSVAEPTTSDEESEINDAAK